MIVAAVALIEEVDVRNFIQFVLLRGTLGPNSLHGRRIVIKNWDKITIPSTVTAVAPIEEVDVKISCCSIPLNGTLVLVSTRHGLNSLCRGGYKILFELDERVVLSIMIKLWDEIAVPLIEAAITLVEEVDVRNLCQRGQLIKTLLN